MVIWPDGDIEARLCLYNGDRTHKPVNEGRKVAALSACD